MHTASRKGKGAKVVEIDDDDDDEVQIMSQGEKTASSSKGALKREDEDDFDDFDFASACQHCKQDDDGMVRLGHCRHVICLTCLKAPYMDKVRTHSAFIYPSVDDGL